MTLAQNKNKLKTLFKRKQENILAIYFTAGFPELNSTTQILHGLQAADVDLIEIGIPYSDPLADGPVIQHSSTEALKNGMTLSLLFKQLEEVSISKPIVLMGYLNPVLQYGMEQFIESCTKAGISGIILPDLPIEIFERDYKSLFENANLEFIGLVTPQSAPDRIEKIDRISSGFVYAVSSASTTGSKNTIGDSIDYLNKLKALNLKNPILTGFNIKDHHSYKIACQHSKGAIIGSAFIKHLESEGCSQYSIQQFTQNIKQPQL